MSKKIYLSPSCQINNFYASGNINEQEQCNRIAEFAKTALERCGFKIKKAPKGQAMTKSISESNNLSADLHIPMNTNAFNGQTLGRMFVMIYSNNTESKKAGSEF